MMQQRFRYGKKSEEENITQKKAMFVNVEGWVHFLYASGFMLLITYTLTRLTLPSLSRLCEVGFVIIGIIILFTQKISKYKSIFIFIIASLVVQLSPWLASFFIQMPAVDGFPSLDRLLKLFIFIPAALIMSKNEQRIYYVWGCALLGFIIATLVDGHDWINGWRGARVDFGIRNAQHTSLYFGASLIGLFCFYKKIISSQENKTQSYTLLTFWFLFSLLGLYITQTRAIFLALSITTIATVLLLPFIISRKINWKATFILIIAFAIPFNLIAKNIISARTESEMSVMNSIYNGDKENIEYTSIGVRVNTWLIAIEKIKERPVLGWGQSARSWVIDQSEKLPEWVKKDFGHLHNYPLEVQLSYGIFGTIWFITFYFYVFYHSYSSWINKNEPNEIFCFASLFIFYFLIANIFESYLSFWTGVYIFNLVCAGVFAAFLKDKEHKNTV